MSSNDAASTHIRTARNSSCAAQWHVEEEMIVI
jgi:hypothetical protein